MQSMSKKDTAESLAEGNAHNSRRSKGESQKPNENYSTNFLLTRLDAINDAIKPKDKIVANTMRTF